MKHSLFIITFFLFTTALIAKDWVTVQSGQPGPAQIQLISSSISQSTVQFSLDGFWKHTVETERGTAWLISLDRGAELLRQSAPELPVFTSSLIVPNRAAMQVEIVSADFIEIQDVLIAPSKGNLSRQVDPSTVAYEFGRYYDRDGDFPGRLAKLNEPYIVRDYRGQPLVFQPFQYNPVTGVLKIYYNITVSVTENGTSGVNTIESDGVPEKVDSRFSNIYRRHFLNYNSGMRYTPVEEEGEMIIIAYGDFMDEIQPLADWKNKKGTPCSVIDVTDIGGSSDIKQFIQAEYDFGNLTFVLLVGDDAQVPSSSIQGNDSDNHYTYVDGNDHYPDLFIGRFSAQTEEQVTTMVNRTLAYEINPVSDTAWYTKAIGIASQEGPGDDGEYDYQHVRNIANNKLLPFTYNYAFELFEGSQGGNDEPGNPSPYQVAEAVNSGATVINYTGHGSTTSWGTSGFSVNNVNTLTNVNRWPFILSVACVNGNFVNSTCFAEAWLRATHNGEPTGAIATLMSTINQSWNPPMHGQDEMNDILTEAYNDNIKRTFGGITMNGCMAMNDAYGSGGWQETDCWTIFGDPSLVIRTAIPAEMTVNHPDSIIMGQTNLTISCDAEGGLAVLSRNGAILGTAVVVDGEATIGLHPLGMVDTMDIVITAFNHRPYVGTVRIVADTEPYIAYAGNTINDVYGNQDGLLDYAEEVALTLAMTNLGHDTATAVTVSLSTPNQYITMMADNVVYGSIAADDTVSVVDGFAFILAENVPDGEIIEFSVTAEDTAERSVWESAFSLVAHAPDLAYVNFSIDDAGGDGNGKLDAGETAYINVDITNLGSADAYNLNALLDVEGGRVAIEEGLQTISLLEGGGSAQFVYSVTADADTPDGYSALFSLNLTADHNISATGEFFTVVGQIPVLVINFSETRTSSDSIAACMNMLHVGADYANGLPDDLSVYKSVFVILGVYPDNYALSTQEGELLAAYLENGGSIYMEGGDAWAFDDQTAVHDMFFINGLEDGSDDLSIINGEDGGFLEGYRFAYDGENNYIDQIAPKTGATLLLSNETPYYGVAVSYENVVYRTIGASISFAGLTDTANSTKAAAMADMLNFFDVGYIWTNVPERLTTEVESAAFPNPFSNRVTITFSLSEQAMVSLDIFDLTGRKVNTLVNGQLDVGNYQYTWDATGINGLKMQSGIYFYSLRFGSQVITKKIILSR